MKSGFPPRRLNFFRLSLSALRAHILHGWLSALPSTAQKLSCICVTSSLLPESRMRGIGNGLPASSAARRSAISTQSGVSAFSESHQKSCIASISAWTSGSGGGTSFGTPLGGGGPFARGGGIRGFFHWGGGGGFFAAPPGGLGGGLSPFGGGMGGFLPAAGGTGGFFWGGGGRGGRSFLASPLGGGGGFLASPLGGGGGGRGGSLASLDAAPAPGDGGASFLAAAGSSFSPPPDSQLPQDPAAADAHSKVTSVRRSMVATRSVSDEGSDSAANLATELL